MVPDVVADSPRFPVSLVNQYSLCPCHSLPLALLRVLIVYNGPAPSPCPQHTRTSSPAPPALVSAHAARLLLSKPTPTFLLFQQNTLSSMSSASYRLKRQRSFDPSRKVAHRIRFERVGGGAFTVYDILRGAGTPETLLDYYRDALVPEGKDTFTLAYPSQVCPRAVLP